MNKISLKNMFEIIKNYADELGFVAAELRINFEPLDKLPKGFKNIYLDCLKARNEIHVSQIEPCFWFLVHRFDVKVKKGVLA